MKNIKISALIIAIIIPFTILAQGPAANYFYNRHTVIPWAKCYVSFKKGSNQKITFLPVINEKTNGPMGTLGYTKNIDINSQIVLIPSGITNASEDIIKNKIVIIYYNSQLSDSLLSCNINRSIEYGASALVVVSNKKAPTISVSTQIELPVISTNENMANAILESAGWYYINKLNTWQKNKESPLQLELPVELRIQIKGKYTTITDKYFNYKYLDGYLENNQIENIQIRNYKSVNFISKLFKELKFEWIKETTHYFSSLDQKIFYTLYWGMGFSSDNGVFNVADIKNREYGLAVHENTHSLFYKNMTTETSSFINEGIAMYAEAMATDTNINNREVADLITRSKLYRLNEMLKFNIGNDTDKTEAGYPSSGSFIEFWIDKYGVKSLKELWQSKLSNLSKTEIDKIEIEWLEWLQTKTHIDNNIIKKHLDTF